MPMRKAGRRALRTANKPHDVYTAGTHGERWEISQPSGSNSSFPQKTDTQTMTTPAIVKTICFGMKFALFAAQGLASFLLASRK